MLKSGFVSVDHILVLFFWFVCQLRSSSWTGFCAFWERLIGKSDADISISIISIWLGNSHQNRFKG